MYTMCPPGCYHNGFMATPELGHRMYGIYTYINELTRNEIASLILGVLDAEMCRAKYKYKRRKLLLVRYSSFTL